MKPVAPLLGLLAICLLAFALRAFRLDGQSLWGDEAYSVWRSGLSWGGIVYEGLREANHPLLHYLVLYFWMPLAGEGEYAVRFPSLWAGVAAVPAFFLLLRRLLRPPGPLLGALLAAFLPFLVYYGQEARMYTQLVLCLVLATYFLLRALDASAVPGASGWPALRLWLLYGLTAGLAMSFFFYAGFVLAAHALYCAWVSGRAWRDGSRRVPSFLRSWLAGEVLILLINLPWIAYAWPDLTRSTGMIQRASVPLERILSGIASGFSLGTSVAPAQAAWLVPGFLALAALGMAALPRRRSLLLLTLVLPLPFTYFISFTPFPNWQRYFMEIVPAYYVFLAAGLGLLWRRAWPLGLAGLLVVAGASGLSLYNYHTEARYQRFDYRTQSLQVLSGDPSQEGVVVNGPDANPFLYYARRMRTAVPYTLLPRPEMQEREDITAELASFIEGKRELWLVKYMPPDRDPGNLIENWLAAHAFRVSQGWVENYTFTHYALPSVSLAQDGPAYRTVGADFGEKARLAGYSLDRQEVEPGGALHLALYWEGQQPVSEDYTVFVHLVGAADRKAAQSDSQPAGDTRPLRTWQPGETVADLRALTTAADAPPGEYRLLVGLYRTGSGERLPLLRNGRPPATQLELATVTIR